MAENSTYRRVNPSTYFETPDDGIVRLQSMAGFLAAGTANAPLITGVAGKRIRLMGWSFAAAAAVAGGTISLKSGSGGRLLLYNIPCPNAALGISNIGPVIDSGYDEADTAVALYCDTGAATTTAYNIFYIIYTPRN